LLIISGGTSASTLRIFELSEFSNTECLEWNGIEISRGQTGRKKLQIKNIPGKPVLQIRIRIRMFLNLPDSDPLVQDSDLDTSIIKQKQ
jgi:hypothetical protein